MIQFADCFKTPIGSPIRELFPYLQRPGMISFAGGYPSPSLFDAQGLAAATAIVLSEGAKILQYGPTEGDPRLKNELSILSSSRGVHALSPDKMMVTSGSQQAFDLLVRVLIEPGDLVLIEAPAYPAAIQALRFAGASIVEVPTDTEGLNTTALAELLESLPMKGRPKFLYTVPSFSNPRGTLLPESRRKALIALAVRYNFLVIEDDPYGELAFEESPPEPIYSIAARGRAADNPVVYLSSLSKTVAPALRVGWMVGPAEVLRRCTVAKQTTDLCTSSITQLIAAEYLRSGRYPATVSAARTEYRARVDVMADQLESSLGPRVRFIRPRGGMFLWLECVDPIDPKRLFKHAVDRGVIFVPGSAFFLNHPESLSMRLSFASPNEIEIRDGIRRLAAAIGLSKH